MRKVIIWPNNKNNSQAFKLLLWTEGICTFIHISLLFPVIFVVVAEIGIYLEERVALIIHTAIRVYRYSNMRWYDLLIDVQ